MERFAEMRAVVDYIPFATDTITVWQRAGGFGRDQYTLRALNQKITKQFLSQIEPGKCDCVRESA